MNRVKIFLWGINAFLTVGIVAFSVRYLLFPSEIDRLKDVDRDAALVSPPGTAKDRPSETALVDLRNPLQPRVDSSTRPPFEAILKGAMPTSNPRQGVAFIKSVAHNAELVARMGEEILQDGKPFDELRGWRLTGLWKDRAEFTSIFGEQTEVRIASIASPQTVERARLAPRIGEPYSTEPR